MECDRFPDPCRTVNTRLHLWMEDVGQLDPVGVTAISVLYAAWDIFIQPAWLYKHWYYDVNEEFLQIKRGALTKVHQIIPMAKIQSVTTNQGPLMRKYGLYSVSVGTMGSSHEIPALPEEVALALRHQIASYARINEVDE